MPKMEPHMSDENVDISGSLPPLSAEVIDNLADRMQDAIKSATDLSPGKPASSTLKKLVAKRVPPKTLAQFNTLDSYHLVLWDECMSILERISAYPHTVGYRKHLSNAPQDVRRAWLIHSHSLRGNELYIVQDRTKAFLLFLYAVANEAGLAATEQSNSFENIYRKRFRRRLHERHEITHAHSRPSLTSRIINMQSALARANDEDKSSMVAQLLGATTPFLAMLEKLQGKPLAIGEVETLQQEGADREAREMLDLFGRAVLKTLNK